MNDCPERAELSKALAAAVKRVYAVRTAMDGAIRVKSDEGLASDLFAARRQERNALKALEDHRKTHGC